MYIDPAYIQDYEIKDYAHTEEDKKILRHFRDRNIFNVLENYDKTEVLHVQLVHVLLFLALCH